MILHRATRRCRPCQAAEKKVAALHAVATLQISTVAMHDFLATLIVIKASSTTHITQCLTRRLANNTMSHQTPKQSIGGVAVYLLSCHRSIVTTMSSAYYGHTGRCLTHAEVRWGSRTPQKAAPLTIVKSRRGPVISYFPVRRKKQTIIRRRRCRRSSLCEKFEFDEGDRRRQ